MLQRYSEFAPTPFDRAGAFLPDRRDWLVAPVGTNRDADELTESNWAVVSADFDRLDPDGKDHEEHSFNHWGPGWFSIILCRPGSPCADLAEEWRQRLENYPVASDDDFCKREFESACEIWAMSDTAERLHYIQTCGADPKVSIFAARRDELPYGIYASELCAR